MKDRYELTTSGIAKDVSLGRVYPLRGDTLFCNEEEIPNTKNRLFKHLCNEAVWAAGEDCEVTGALLIERNCEYFDSDEVHFTIKNGRFHIAI